MTGAAPWGPTATAGRTTDVPYVTTDQMVEIDRLMIEELHIDLVQMMENAGRAFAHLARQLFLGGNPNRARVVALAGSGGNGGGVLVAARRLHTWGAEVRVVLSALPDTLKEVTAHQLDALVRIGVPVMGAESVSEGARPDLVLDGIVGYRLEGPPRGAAAQLIEWANVRDAPTLALDLPSGFDATRGAVFQPVIVASATLALALPKEGLRSPGAEPYVGELYLADIGVPPALYHRIGLRLPVGPLFARDDILRL